MSKEIVEITIEADWNDADYVTNTWEADEESVKVLKDFIDKYPVLKARCGVEQLNQTGTLSEDEEDYLSDILPYGYEGNEMHSIESINVKRYTLHEEEKLL